MWIAYVSSAITTGFVLTFAPLYEDGNVTQVTVTFLESEVGVVINGTADGLFVQVIVPYEFKVV